MVQAIVCPQCNAPLTPHPFARSIVCPYCGTTVRFDDAAISAAAFHEAYQAWNTPEAYGFSSWTQIGNRHWAVEQWIAQGEISDVYAARLARWPTELAVLKLLRDRQDIAMLDQEWDALQALHNSDARGADTFTRLLPQPILHGDVTSGAFAGQRVSIFRRPAGFHHNFEEVIQAYPQGIPPRASIWIWRRILEVLSFIHASGMVHGAVLPAHLLVQENEHGIRLVGYGHSGRPGGKLRAVPAGSEAFYPEPSGSTLAFQLDLAMSARCVAAVLGGDPATGSVPEAVPAELAAVIQRTAVCKPSAASADAWSLREELGEIAQKVFGPPQFIPIVMPSQPGY